MNAVEADRCALVFLRENRTMQGGYDVSDSGVLTYDGEVLTLNRQDGSSRTIAEDEQGRMMNVTSANQIRECAGFQFFILEPA